MLRWHRVVNVPGWKEFKLSEQSQALPLETTSRETTQCIDGNQNAVQVLGFLCLDQFLPQLPARVRRTACWHEVDLSVVTCDAGRRVDD